MASRAGRILYLERGGGLVGAGGRIGRVRVSKTGRTLYYGAATLQTLGGSGYKANYFDVHTGEHYWVSGPRRDGNDPLYPGLVEIDADARAEYWCAIRGRPESVLLASFRAAGKHSKRHPHAENARRRSF